MPTFGRIAYYLNIDLGKREKDPIIQSQQANQTLEVSGKKLEKELYNVCCLKYWLWQGHCGYKTKHLFSRGLKRSFSWKGLWCLCVIPSYDSESRMYSEGINFEKLMNLHVDHHQLYVLLQVKLLDLKFLQNNRTKKWHGVNSVFLTMADYIHWTSFISKWK